MPPGGFTSNLNKLFANSCGVYFLYHPLLYSNSRRKFPNFAVSGLFWINFDSLKKFSVTVLYPFGNIAALFCNNRCIWNTPLPTLPANLVWGFQTRFAFKKTKYPAYQAMPAVLPSKTCIQVCSHWKLLQIVLPDPSIA